MINELSSQEVTGSLNVNELREYEVASIRTDVQRAYKNRAIKTYIPEKTHSEEDLQKAREQKSLFDLDDNTIVDTGEYVEQEYTASVSNSHDYKTLLTIGFETLADDGYFDREMIPHVVEENLEHEYQHHVPGLGYDDLKIRYCVSFMEDPKRGFRGLMPFINLSGQLQIGVFKNIVGAAKQRSATDKILLGE